MAEAQITEARAAFVTHWNYLQAFQTIVAVEYSRRPAWMMATLADVLAGLASQVESSGCLRRFRHPDGSSVDFALLRRALRNAWGTELLLATKVNDELVGVANNWNVVQAYYACYQVVQGLTVARGLPALTSHEKLQNQFAAMWIVRSVALAPWSSGYKSGAPTNLPSGAVVREVRSAWESCDEDSCWPIALKALKTTREDTLKRQFSQARKDKRTARNKQWERAQQERRLEGRRALKTKPSGRMNLTEEDKGQIDAHLRATSIIDYLYRLRMRSNYEDPTMFTDGPDSVRESRDVHRFLTWITASTLLLHELHVRELVGREQFESLLGDWLNESGQTNVGLGLRRDILLAS